MVLATGVMAQLPVDGNHYPVGLNGIKGGSSPEPGIYLRDDNWIYTGSSSGFSNHKAFVYLQAPQLMWMTDWKILGANLGMDIEMPIIYKDTSYTALQQTPGGLIFGFTRSGSEFGLGDIKVEPLILSWHWKHFDTTLAYALWVPSGKYSGINVDLGGTSVNLGDDEWSHMFTLGGVWYPDDDKTWAVSILHHYEFAASQTGSITVLDSTGRPIFMASQKIPCSVYTVEWGVSKTILTNIDAGLVGYYQKQFTDNSPAATDFKDSEVAGIGPEISALIPRWGLTASVRYAYEFTAYHREKGHMVNLTVTKKF